MRRAMHNVEQHYAVVGVLEDLNKTLTVLEHYVPRFFKGALNTYWSKLKYILVPYVLQNHFISISYSNSFILIIL